MASETTVRTRKKPVRPNDGSVRVGKAFHERQEKGQRRTTIIFGVVLFMTLAVLFRLFQLQVVSYETYDALATGQHQIYEDLKPERGEILVEDPFSNELVPIATNKEFAHVYAVPRDIENVEEAVLELSKLFDVDEEDLKERLSREGDLYEPIKHRVDEEGVRKLGELGLSGVHTQPETFRNYPDGSFAAHLLGFVRFDGQEHKGQYGLEGSFDDELRGTNGFLRAERDALGRFVASGESAHEKAQDGSDIVLTLNRTIQFHTERILAEGVEKFGAEEGSAIVLDPTTGEVLALANAPTFDPNEYGKVEKVEDYVNSAVHDLYEPGSTFKPLVMSAAINEGLVSPNTIHDDTAGEVKVGPYTIRNFDDKPNGYQTMTNVLERSSNTGMVFVSDKLGAQRMYDYFVNFGLTRPTGIDVPESYGSMLPASTWTASDQATRAFGQSFAITPLQLAVAESAFANSGVIMKPHVIEKIIHANGEEDVTPIEELATVLTPETADTVAAMMVSTVENGFGDTAKVEGYHIAGKTGTAQVPRKDGVPGYDQGSKITSFIGFGPIEDPKFLVLVKLNNPGGDVWGSSTAGPLAKEIMEETIRVLRIPPSYE
ncbi:MAG: penicillin-binding protein 2 [Candidatus Doudnabacteria bacterium]|nr:penicillin-binding protein 2 [Candidatus Doudnabacteria bacterium]